MVKRLDVLLRTYGRTLLTLQRFLQPRDLYPRARLLCCSESAAQPVKA